MKLFLIYINILAYFTFSLCASSQNWPIIIGDNTDINNATLIEDYDKGYLLSNWILDNNGYSKYGSILKTDINGSVLWEKTFGNGNYTVYFSSARRTKDNSIIISGSIGKYDNEVYLHDPLFLKLNVCGEVEWCTVLHKEGSNGNDYGIRIIQLDSNNYIGMIKYYGSQVQTVRISLVKLDGFGNPVWIQNLAQEDSTVSNEEGYDLLLTTNSNLLVAGQGMRSALRPYFILCNDEGDELWNFAWENELWSGASDRVVEKDSGIFYASGAGKFNNNYFHPALFKFNSNGQGEYYKLLLGDSIRGGGACPLAIINDTSFAIGYNWGTDPNPNYGNSEISVIDTLGNIIYSRLLIEQVLVPDNIIKTYDGKIVVTGDYYINGNNWDIHFWKMNDQLVDDSLYSRIFTYDSLCPYSIESDTIDLNCGIFVDINDIPINGNQFQQLSIFPNPSSDYISIEAIPGTNCEIKILNFLGKTVHKVELPDTGKVLCNTMGWNKGIYIVSLFCQHKYICSKKLIVN